MGFVVVWTADRWYLAPTEVVIWSLSDAPPQVELVADDTKPIAG